MTSALALADSPALAAPYISGEVLAATKLAHEFGHVNYAARGDMHDYLRQLQLVPVYNRIFLANGRDVNDPRLVELARMMGGAPVEIGQDREHWAEVNALRYLRERIPERKDYQVIFRAIRRAVGEYARNHTERFH